MKKKLTRDCFSALRETAIVLDEEFQRKIQGGCTSDDHGIGYTDSGGNYHWTRTSDCDGNCWSSGSSSSSSNYGSSSEYESYSQYYNGSSSGYYGSSYSGSSSAYGTAENPIKQSDYWKLDSADRWYGGYVEGLGYVAGDSIVTNSSYSSTSGSYYGSSSYYNGSSVYGSSSFDYWSYLYGSSASGGSSSYDSLSRPSSGGNNTSGDTQNNPCGYTVMDGLCTQGAILEALCRFGISPNQQEINRDLLQYQYILPDGRAVYNVNDNELNSLLNKYFNAQPITSLINVTQAILQGKLVYAEFVTGKDSQGKNLTHSVIITNIDNITETITYYDPVSGKSETVNSNQTGFLGNRLFTLDKK